MSENFDFNDDRFSNVRPKMDADFDETSIKRKEKVSTLTNSSRHSVASSDRISRKFKVGSVNDAAESEADAVADSFLKSNSLSEQEIDGNIGINNVV